MPHLKVEWHAKRPTKEITERSTLWLVVKLLRRRKGASLSEIAYSVPMKAKKRQLRAQELVGQTHQWLGYGLKGKTQSDGRMRYWITAEPAYDAPRIPRRKRVTEIGIAARDE